MNQSQTSLVNPSTTLKVKCRKCVSEEFNNDVWLWFILSINLVSITFYTIPTSISFFREIFYVRVCGKFLEVREHNLLH